MLYLSFRISNPFAKESEDCGWSKSFSVTKNKMLVIEYSRSTVLLEISFSWTHRTSNAGLRLDLGFLGQQLSVAFEDARYWDPYLDCWEPEEVVDPNDEAKFQELVELIKQFNAERENQKPND